MDKNIKKILNLLTLYEYNVIGSATDKNIKFVSDVDAQENILLDSSNPNIYHEIYLFYKKLFMKLKTIKNIYVIDFKCGHQNNTQPLRWDYDDIMNGYIQIDNTNYTFETALNQKSIIKIDIILLDKNDKLYHEMSVNYYYEYVTDTVESFKTNPLPSTKDEIITSLKLDIEEYKKEQKYYKLLKRQYSLNKLLNID